MRELKAKDTRILKFPVDYVYKTLTDFASYSKWWPHAIKFDIEHLNPSIIGTTINIQNGPFIKWKSKITGFKTNKLLAIDYIDGAWLGKTYYRFGEKDDGTELSLEIDLEVNRMWLKVLSLPMNFAAIHSRQVKHVFNNLERYLHENESEFMQNIQVSHIEHIVLTVKNIEETLEFYNSVLGMEIITFGEGRKALKFGIHKINLHDAGNEFTPKAASPVPGSADICFISHVPINRIVQELKNKKVEIIEGPVEKTGAAGKIVSVYFRDPDGNLIELSNIKT
jgi:catechol 2,3-dioxygenase-like lactoylglutathione lyase family enzyme